MFTKDLYNNIRRFCSVDNTSGRVWRVQAAVTGGRYLVRNTTTGQCRVVRHNQLSNLY